MAKFFPFVFGFLVFAAPANAALLVNYDFNSGSAKASTVAGGLTAFEFNQTGITAGITSSFGTNASGIYNGNPAENSTNGSSYVDYRVNSTTGRFEAQLNGSMSNTNALDASGTNARTFALVRVTNNTPYRFNLTSFSYSLNNASPTSGTFNGGSTTGTPTIVEQTQFRVVNSSNQNSVAYGGTSTGSNTTFGNTSTVTNRSLGVSLLSGESIEIRVALRRVGTGGVRIFSIDDFRIDGDVVPEPASIAIFSGLAALGFVRRARRK
jgi:hypothetical protein